MDALYENISDHLIETTVTAGHEKFDDVLWFGSRWGYICGVTLN